MGRGLSAAGDAQGGVTMDADDQKVDSDVLHARVLALGVSPGKVAQTITLLRADPRLADALVLGARAVMLALSRRHAG